MSPTAFRNVEVDPSASPDEWPMEAIETVVDRGELADWRRVAQAIRADPWGSTARAVEQIASWADHGPIARLLSTITRAERERVTLSGRRRHAERIRSLRASTGLSLRAFARRVGTSAARLSDYENAKVSPTTDVLGRIEAAAERDPPVGSD